MKTLTQLLQSRISRRRNFITDMEMDRMVYKDWGLYDKARELTQTLKTLAEDQKLDKRLYEVLIKSGRA